MLRGAALPALPAGAPPSVALARRRRALRIGSEWVPTSLAQPSGLVAPVISSF